MLDEYLMHRQILFIYCILKTKVKQNTTCENKSYAVLF